MNQCRFLVMVFRYEISRFLHPAALLADTLPMPSEIPSFFYTPSSTQFPLSTDIGRWWEKLRKASFVLLLSDWLNDDPRLAVVTIV